jgi:hypothetical protein
MWTHLSLNVEVVWDDVLYRLIAIWQDHDAAEPVVLEKGGRAPLGDDRSPEGAMRAALAASAAELGQERPGVPADLGSSHDAI